MNIIIVDTYENQQLVAFAEEAAGWYPIRGHRWHNEIVISYVVYSFPTQADAVAFMKGMAA